MPNDLFSFGLKHLKLTYCNLRLPFSFKGFGRLVELDLRDVLIEHAELSEFISKCPLLEHLSLTGDMFPCLTIDAPNLKSFCLDVNSEIPSVCLKNTSFLEEVSISTIITEVKEEISEGSQINMIELLCQLSSVKKLTLHHDFMLACTDTNYDMIPSTDQYLEDQQKLEHNFCNLKHVKISNFAGDKPEMEFVKLILSAATSLEKLELELHDCLEVASEEGYRLIGKLTEFRRPDVKVKIVIEDGCDMICLKRVAKH